MSALLKRWITIGLIGAVLGSIVVTLEFMTFLKSDQNQDFIDYSGHRGSIQNVPGGIIQHEFGHIIARNIGEAIGVGPPLDIDANIAWHNHNDIDLHVVTPVSESDTIEMLISVQRIKMGDSLGAIQSFRQIESSSQLVAGKKVISECCLSTNRTWLF